MKATIVLTIAVMALAFAAPASAQTSNETKLINQRAKLLGALQYKRKALTSVRAELRTAREERDKALATAMRSTELEMVLRSNLPTMIEAVSPLDFRNLVFRPAFNTYPSECRSFTSVGSSWSYTFYSPNLC